MAVPLFLALPHLREGQDLEGSLGTGWPRSSKAEAAVGTGVELVFFCGRCPCRRRRRRLLLR